MKDLDFDELDRAVNSLMADTKETSVPSKQLNDEAVVTIHSTMPAASPSPVATAPIDTAPASKAASPSPASSFSTAERTMLSSKPSSGRFMDIVHPSLDMKSPKSPTSRVGTTLAPLSPEIASPPSTSNQEPEAPMPGSPSQSEATPIAPEPSLPKEPEAHSSWPDPLEFNRSNSGDKRPVPDEKTSDTLPVETKEAEENTAASEAPAEESAAPASLDEPPKAPASVVPVAAADSPFLPNSQVEKRPLGAPTDLAKKADDTTSSSDVAEESNEQSPEPETIENIVAPEKEPPSTPNNLPAELKSDVLAIEADDAASTMVGGTVKPAPTQHTPSVSIAHQYKVQHSTSDQSHKAIYDSEEPELLAHPPKKKSSLGVVIGILLFVVLGIAGGALYYVFIYHP